MVPLFYVATHCVRLDANVVSDSLSGGNFEQKR
jgi:hypothetical protein